MLFSNFPDARITEKTLTTTLKKLSVYRQMIAEASLSQNQEVSEYSLYHCKEFELHDAIYRLRSKYKSLKHLVLIGIGGSSLGTEAVHEALGENGVVLDVLDAVSPYKLYQVVDRVTKYKKAKDVAVCVISKSGGTAETLTNASALLEILTKHFGESFHDQVIMIGDSDSKLVAYAKKNKYEYVRMPKIIGGRFSVATAVGLIPLALLRHDVDEFIEGYLAGSETHYEEVAAQNAVQSYHYHKLKYHHLNFYAFDTRLSGLGRWYRQLMAESLGKETTKDGKKQSEALLPTISTPVELHSIGQLYFSGVAPVYTDFVTYDDEENDLKIPKKGGLAGTLAGLSMQELATALYGAVLKAYQERKLPYRTTVFEEDLPYSLGLFMAIRIREIMYTAHLMGVDAFDQPNVELYKIKLREILSK